MSKGILGCFAFVLNFVLIAMLGCISNAYATPVRGFHSCNRLNSVYLHVKFTPDKPFYLKGEQLRVDYTFTVKEDPKENPNEVERQYCISSSWDSLLVQNGWKVIGKSLQDEAIISKFNPIYNGYIVFEGTGKQNIFSYCFDVYRFKQAGFRDSTDSYPDYPYDEYRDFGFNNNIGNSLFSTDSRKFISFEGESIPRTTPLPDDFLKPSTNPDYPVSPLNRDTTRPSFHILTNSSFTYPAPNCTSITSVTPAQLANDCTFLQYVQNDPDLTTLVLTTAQQIGSCHILVQRFIQMQASGFDIYPSIIDNNCSEW